MSKATDMIAVERNRQVIEKGYDANHDRDHVEALILAAESYLFNNDGLAKKSDSKLPPGPWPWAEEFWKPTGDPKLDLVKAAALIAAAIDSLLDS